MPKASPIQGTFTFLGAECAPKVAPPAHVDMPTVLRDDDDPGEVERDAVIVGAFRYRLSRRWNAALPTVAWVMLNPSSADDTGEDQTSRKCIGFARRWGYGAIEVVNLYAFRATDPDELLSRLAEGVDVIGPELELHARDALVGAREVIVAPGSHPSVTPERLRVLLALVSPGVPVSCLGRTKQGYPRHPRVLGYAAEREPYKVP